MNKKLKEGYNFTIGIILFLVLVGIAFSTSFLFGFFYFLGFLYSIYTKKLKKNFQVPIWLFGGGILMRIAILNLFSLQNSETILDLIISLSLLSLLGIIGFKMKRI
ncbi:MAG: hypothetical protein ABH804_00165 [archaeon]